MVFHGSKIQRCPGKATGNSNAAIPSTGSNTFFKGFSARITNRIANSGCDAVASRKPDCPTVADRQTKNTDMVSG